MPNKATPLQRIAVESNRRGRVQFVTGCITILDGSMIDGDLVAVLGGEHAHYVLSGAEGGVEGYWPRVWAARGLLHCYEPIASEVIGKALQDKSWRVREMLLKVIARYEINELIEDVVPLRDDPIERVRLTVERVLRKLTSDPTIPKKPI